MEHKNECKTINGLNAFRQSELSFYKNKQKIVIIKTHRTYHGKYKIIWQCSKLKSYPVTGSLASSIVQGQVFWTIPIFCDLCQCQCQSVPMLIGASDQDHILAKYHCTKLGIQPVSIFWTRSLGQSSCLCPDRSTSFQSYVL